MRSYSGIIIVMQEGQQQISFISNVPFSPAIIYNSRKHCIVVSVSPSPLYKWQDIYARTYAITTSSTVYPKRTERRVGLLNVPPLPFLHPIGILVRFQSDSIQLLIIMCLLQ